MRVLLTSTRAPVTLEMARAFARAGHWILGADTFGSTIAAWSRFVSRHVVVPSPRFAREAFILAILRAIEREAIDLVVPTCEEVFAIARGRDRIARVAGAFVSDAATLRMLHDKWAFTDLAASLGLSVPDSALVRTPAEIETSCARFPRWVAKPVFSRFAARLTSNVEGLPRRDHAAVPTEAEPWIVQRFVDGTPECSYSIVHGGRIVAHVAYAVPVRHGAGSGVRFVSVDPEPTLAAASAIARETGFTGQLSLDFVANGDDRVVLECNPRATSGVHLMDPSDLVDAMLNPGPSLRLAPAGRTRQLALPAMAALARGWGAPVRALAATRYGDVIMRATDPGPAAAQVPMAVHFLRVAWRERRSLASATTFDIEWNGDGG